MTIPAPALAIGVDLGGSKVSGGVLDATGAIVERIQPRPAQADTHDEVLRTVAEIVTELRRRHRVQAVGLGAAALVDWPTGNLRWSFRTGYIDLDLRRLVAQSTGLPVIVDNDANAAAWGETVTSAEGGGPDEYLAMLCVGSGLGGGFVLGGEVYRGATGIAAEIAHLPVDSGSTEPCRCGCGVTGALGTLAGGHVVVRAAQRAAEADPAGLIARLGSGAQGVTGQTLADAARQGDPVAHELFAGLGRRLGVAAAVLTTLLDLRRIVVGGGMAAAGDLFLDQMRATLRHHLFARAHRPLPTVEPARLGSDASWVGAGLLALRAAS